jgi:hypothetical protein
MNITEHITRERYEYRGGGCELDLTSYGYEDEFLSAFQNYLGGGLLGAVANDCTVAGWRDDKKLVRLAKQLREHYWQQMQAYDCVDELADMPQDRPVSAY